MQPLNMLIFGDLTQNIIKFAGILTSSTDPDEQESAAENFMEDITTFAVYNTYIGLGTLVTTYLSTVIFNYTAARQMYRVRTLYLEKTLNQDIGWYDMNQTGDLASRMAE